MLPELFKEKYFGVCQDYYEKLKKECNKCDHQGHILKDERTYVDCDCTKTFLNNKEYIKIGVPVSIFNLGAGKFTEIFTEDCRNNFKTLIKFIKQLNTPTNIFIHSNEKKDYATNILSSLIAINLLKAEYDVCLVKSYGLFDTFFDFDKESQGIDALIETKFLIIDCFGQENNKQLRDGESFVSTKFLNLLNQRSSMNGVTILAGDIILEDAKKKYCPQIYNYLINDCLKFEASTTKGKENALEQLKQTNPEFADIFSKRKISAVDGEGIKPVKMNNRGRIL